MNWKEFKEAVEAQGVTDSMVVSYIDVSYPKTSEDVRVVRERKYDTESVVIVDYEP